MKNLAKDTEKSFSKKTYVKPTMEVYEVELDAAVLTDTQSGLSGSEAKIGDVQNPFYEMSDDLKA